MSTAVSPIERLQLDVTGRVNAAFRRAFSQELIYGA